MTIVGGLEITGDAYLGGSCFADNEPIGTVHGYLPQMLHECATDLLAVIGYLTPRNELIRAIDFLDSIDIEKLAD